MFLTASAKSRRELNQFWIIKRRVYSSNKNFETLVLILTCGILPKRFHVVFDVQQSTILRSVNHFV